MTIFAGQRSTPEDWNLLADWDTYTPALTTATTNPNVGADGDAEGLWWRTGQRIRGFARFYFDGAGIDPGSGTLRISLPFPADPALNSISGIGGQSTVAGSGRLQDFGAGANSHIVHAFLANVAYMSMQRSGSSSFVSATSPFTYAQDDAITVNFDYLADPVSLPTAPVNQDLWQPGNPLGAAMSRHLDIVRSYEARLIASTTNPDLGDLGTATGFYQLSGRWVTCVARFRFAPSGTVDNGGGGYWVLMPFPADTSLVTLGQVRTFMIGDGVVIDQSTPGNSSLVTIAASADDTEGVPLGQLALIQSNNTNVTVNSTFPFTWSNGDRISVRFSYPADPAALTAAGLL